VMSIVLIDCWLLLSCLLFDNVLKIIDIFVEMVF